MECMIRSGSDLECPHCGGTGLAVTGIFIFHEADGMRVEFDTVPFRLDLIDGGDGEGFVTLRVECPCCSPKGDLFYLCLMNGTMRAGDGIACARWITDGEEVL